MPSFRIHSEQKIAAAAERILDRNGMIGPVHLARLPGGANNRVYLVRQGDNAFLMKCYYRHPQDGHDRLGHEYVFVSLAWEKGIRSIPRPYGKDAQNDIGLYEYIHGRKLQPHEVEDGMIQKALEFIGALQRNRHEPEALLLPLASEACMSIQEHIAVVDQRLGQLQKIRQRDPVDDEGREFIARRLKPAWHRVRRDARQKAKIEGKDIDRTLKPDECCLSPSDFGFHNALLENDGTLRFIDFEYAGWDDPAKLICDFFCQPAIPVPLDYFDEVAGSVARSHADRRTVTERAGLLLPVYRLKWCCILLNEFMSVGANRRDFAETGRRADRKARQLEKVRAYYSAHVDG